MSPADTPEQLQLTRDEHRSTVQVLVANEGNRRVICEMLTDQFEVETGDSVRDADLYLVEDRLLDRYREPLRAQVGDDDPVFCPVVIIQRGESGPAIAQSDAREGEMPLLVDEFIEAPVRRQRLVSRLRSLLVRRHQSRELQAQVRALERTERKLRRFERAVEESGTATVITDTDGVIEYANTEFEELTGHGRDAVVEQPLAAFLAADTFGPTDDSFWRTLAEQQEWSGELLVERKAGQRRITDTTITPIRGDSGETEGFVAVMPDITERIEQEQQLRDREQELDLLRQILSRYLRHNLRNDLNVILANAEMLETELSEEDAQKATKIVDTANRLIKTSEEARKYSSLIEQESELLSHDVASLVEETVSEISEQYPEVGIEVDTPDECRLLAREGLAEAFRALVDNAARHNTADTPRVQVTVTESEGIQVVIEDNGPGISEVELETLEQGSETPLRHSQGIGLWFSKWIIEGSGGQLSFDTTVEGTRVTVDLADEERGGAQAEPVSDLKAREQRLKTITQRMTDAVLEVDSSWEITFVDEHAERILGVDAAAIRGQQFWDVFADAQGTRFEAVYRDVMQSRSVERVETYYAGIDAWLEVYVYPDFDGGLSFYFRDVTDRNEREQELALKSTAMDEAPVGITITDPTQEDNPIIYANDEFKRLTGYSDAETIGRNCRFLQGENTASERVAEMREAIEAMEPVTVELRNYRADGTEFWNRVSIAPIQTGGTDSTHYVGFQQDVTAKKEREHALEERVKELAAIQRTARTFLQSGGALEERFGTFIEALPQSFQYPEHTAARISYKEYETSTVNFEQRQDSLTAQMETETGGTVRIDAVYLADSGDDDPFLPEEQELLDTLCALVGSYVERWEYVKQLEQQNEQLETKTSQLDAILEHTTRPLFMKSADGEYLLVNREYREQFGLDETEVIGRTDFELHPREMAEEVRANDQKVIETGEPIEIEERIIVDGEERLYLSSKVPIYFDDDTEPDAVFGMATDITERTARQEELERQNEQLETFANVVSHDLRSPLSIAQGRVELLKEECQSEQIGHIEAAHRRMETLIGDLLALARDGTRVGETEPVVLSELVDSCWQSVETADATLANESEQTVRADESRLRQLFENVVRNAVDHGGPAVTVTVGDLEDGFYIEDDGPGIDPENRESVFETGYSTAAEGTGFGLSIVKQIADGHGWTCHITDGAQGGVRVEVRDVDIVE